MKSILRKIAPIVFLDYLNKKRYSGNNSPYRNKAVTDVFSDIHKNNRWGSTESVSGQGSTLEMSSEAVRFLQHIIEKYQPKSILDLPCGDFNWMRKVDLSGIDYLGGDIVQDLIDQNNEKYGTDKVNFKQLDVIGDELPSADLIIVRDCFVHFSYDKILQSLQNIKRADCKYILTTTFTGQSLNYDIVTGDWRPLNLRKKPFNFPEPLMAAEEYCPPEFRKENRGKSMALWRVDDLV